MSILLSYQPGSMMLAKYIDMNWIREAFVYKEEKSWQVLLGMERTLIGIVEGEFRTKADAEEFKDKLNAQIASVDTSRQMIELLDAIDGKASLESFKVRPFFELQEAAGKREDDGLYAIAATRLLQPMSYVAVLDAYSEILHRNPGVALVTSRESCAYLDESGNLVGCSLDDNDDPSFEDEYEFSPGGFTEDGHWEDMTLEQHWRSLLQPKLINLGVPEQAAKPSSAMRMG